jgi:hypothetical protein
MSIRVRKIEGINLRKGATKTRIIIITVSFRSKCKSSSSKSIIKACSYTS